MWTVIAIGGMRAGMMTQRILLETIGWFGAALLLAAYLLLSNGRMSGQSRPYQWMNVVGAICFVINSGYNGAMPSATLNVVWAGIGFYTLWRVRRRAA